MSYEEITEYQEYTQQERLEVEEGAVGALAGTGEARETGSEGHRGSSRTAEWSDVWQSDGCRDVAANRH